MTTPNSSRSERKNWGELQASRLELCALSVKEYLTGAQPTWTGFSDRVARGDDGTPIIGKLTGSVALRMIMAACHYAFTGDDGAREDLVQMLWAFASEVHFDEPGTTMHRFSYIQAIVLSLEASVRRSDIGIQSAARHALLADASHAAMFWCGGRIVSPGCNSNLDYCRKTSKFYEQLARPDDGTKPGNGMLALVVRTRFPELARKASNMSRDAHREPMLRWPVKIAEFSDGSRACWMEEWASFHGVMPFVFLRRDGRISTMRSPSSVKPYRGQKFRSHVRIDDKAGEVTFNCVFSGYGRGFLSSVPMRLVVYPSGKLESVKVWGTAKGAVQDE